MATKEHLDIFDRIMHLPLLRVFEPFYKKHKEILMYLFFGGIAFFMNLGLFIAIDKILGVNELINNIVCWIVSILFQFFTNRVWVFKGHVDSTKDFFKQLGAFFLGRVFTLIVEEIILGVFITWLGFDATPVKLIAQIVTIVLNYIVSKWIIFKKPQQ